MLYEWLKTKCEARRLARGEAGRVELEVMLSDELPRPADCVLTVGGARFVYWILERGMRGRDKLIRVLWGEPDRALCSLSGLDASQARSSPGAASELVGLYPYPDSTHSV